MRQYTLREHVITQRARLLAVMDSRRDEHASEELRAELGEMQQARVIAVDELWRMVVQLDTAPALEQLRDAFIADPWLPFARTAFEYELTENRWILNIGAVSRDGRLACSVWLVTDRDTNYAGSFVQRAPGSHDFEASHCAAQVMSTFRIWQPALSTFCLIGELLRTRQVTLVCPPRQLRRAAKRSGRAVEWHTVHVDPVLRRRLFEQPAAATAPRELRLHMVRGHEADYTTGRGLFGKHKVKVKVREHWRGDPANGLLFTDKWVIRGPEASA